MSQNRNMEKRFMSEIETLLADFEITKTMFIDHIMDLDDWNFGEQSGNEEKGKLERGNLYQYFRGARPIPLSKLWRIVYYLWDYQDNIEDKQQRELFSERAEKIAGKVVTYLNQANTPVVIRRTINETLENMQDQQIELLFNSLHIFSVSEHVWNFWACYCCLNGTAQKEIRKLLSSYPLSPMAYGANFYQYRLWDSEINRPTQIKFEKSWKKYYRAGKDKINRQKFINEASALLYDYPYSFQNVVQNFFQRAAAPAEMTIEDWSIIIAYGLLQSAVSSEIDVSEHITIDDETVTINGKLLEIDKTILALLSDEINWRRNPAGDATISKGFVKYYETAFRSSSTADWF